MTDWNAARVLIVQGGEDFLKDAAVFAIKESLPHHIVIEVTAGEDPDTQAQNPLTQPSFIPESKLVIMHDANKVANNKWLTAYCENPNPSHTLVLVASSGRKAKWFTTLKRDDTFQCETLKPWEYKEWIVSYCRRKGYVIDMQYADAIHSNVGSDLYALANELQKMFLKMGMRKTFTVPDITSVMVAHQTLSPVRVVQPWAAKQSNTALDMLTRYFHQNTEAYSYLPLISILLGQVEKMICLLSYSRSEFSKTDICAHMSISPYIYEQIQRDVHLWKLKQLRAAYLELCAIDAKVKQGRDGEQLMYWFITQTFEDN